MKLTTKLVEDFIRLKATVKKYTELAKNTADDIKEEMDYQKIEEFGPRDSQRMLFLSKYEQFDPSYYKDMAEWAYKKLFGRRWKTKFEEHAENGMKDVVALKDKANPDYRR